ncbi:DUF4422 domain-containing protein [Parablautia muri]|uniref:DUF4422 domain-containing protein n=1 Tax=Parablautia muri TaxID=2320879 RepID=A0A9X5BIS3_9FIRM|nr:DUF4422 domain-containing protein [Parablautia muri]NBJ94860.1 DUF4422 domain-containing protein [Parablautia muri]
MLRGMKQIVIFGAKSIALGACLAVKKVCPEYEVSGFMVSSLSGNASCLCGLPVAEVDCFTDKNVCILIATPEDVQGSIETMLKGKGFQNIVCLDSEKESALMGKYFRSIGRFPALRNDIAEVYMAKFHRDKPLKNNYRIPDWVRPIQVGAALADKRIAETADDLGENISAKNVNYCELTALYWIWKNKLQEEKGAPYLGLFHYRRFLELTDDDLLHMKNENVDVVLPYPTVHEPDIREHHSRYIAESDWEAMLRALKELEPGYAGRFEEILRQPYLYNYNIVVAKREILKDYCKWLFPILERTEELSTPKGNERADRYIGYLGENLLTLFFMYHGNEWNIKHVGRKMLI